MRITFCPEASKALALLKRRITPNSLIFFALFDILIKNPRLFKIHSISLIYLITTHALAKASLSVIFRGDL
tara:strand:- start:12 stop:224 length:213 start_codon:yes stop_codon:yes gene_type:complete